MVAVVAEEPDLAAPEALAAVVALAGKAAADPQAALAVPAAMVPLPEVNNN